MGATADFLETAVRRLVQTSWQAAVLAGIVINHLALDRADSYEVASVSVIDRAANKTETIRLLNGSTCIRGIHVSPDGKYVYAAHLLSRYQMPTTQVERGRMVRRRADLKIATKQRLEKAARRAVGGLRPRRRGITIPINTQTVRRYSD